MYQNSYLYFTTVIKIKMNFLNFPAEIAENSLRKGCLPLILGKIFLSYLDNFNNEYSNKYKKIKNKKTL
jgi:hypothetical protein